MGQYSSPPIEPRRKSNRPVLALALSLSSTFFCCISFVVNNPHGFDAYIENNPILYVAQALLCVTMIVSLIGATLGGLSLRAKDDNSGLSVVALIAGILMFFLALGVFGYVLMFIGVIGVFGV